MWAETTIVSGDATGIAVVQPLPTPTFTLAPPATATPTATIVPVFTPTHPATATIVAPDAPTPTETVLVTGQPPVTP